MFASAICRCNYFSNAAKFSCHVSAPGADMWQLLLLLVLFVLFLLLDQVLLLSLSLNPSLVLGFRLTVI